MTLVTSDTMGHARELIMPTLHEMVDRLDRSTRLAVSYHFGWCDEQGRSANVNGGKTIRPALALLGAKACGADPQMALPGAAAVELIHNFSLVMPDYAPVAGPQYRADPHRVRSPISAYLKPNSSVPKLLVSTWLIDIPFPVVPRRSRRSKRRLQEKHGRGLL